MQSRLRVLQVLKLFLYRLLDRDIDYN